MSGWGGLKVGTAKTRREEREEDNRMREYVRMILIPCSTRFECKLEGVEVGRMNLVEVNQSWLSFEQS